MTASKTIEDFAANIGRPFSKTDLLAAWPSGIKISEKSLMPTIYRLIKNGRLQKLKYGLYVVPSESKPQFIYRPSNEEIELYKLLDEELPFADKCVWRPSTYTQFMHHVPINNATFVDIDRVAMESAFNIIQKKYPQNHIFINPTPKEMIRIVPSSPSIIIRPLVLEAPIVDVDGIKVPSLEKLMIDALKDRELNYLQGAELYTVYENITERYFVNSKRLYRYASRRNRQVALKKILNSIDYDTSR